MSQVAIVPFHFINQDVLQYQIIFYMYCINANTFSVMLLISSKKISSHSDQIYFPYTHVNRHQLFSFNYLSNFELAVAVFCPGVFSSLYLPRSPHLPFLIIGMILAFFCSGTSPVLQHLIKFSSTRYILTACF